MRKYRIASVKSIYPSAIKKSLTLFVVLAILGLLCIFSKDYTKILTEDGLVIIIMSIVIPLLIYMAIFFKAYEYIYTIKYTYKYDIPDFVLMCENTLDKFYKWTFIGTATYYFLWALLIPFEAALDWCISLIILISVLSPVCSTIINSKITRYGLPKILSLTDKIRKNID